ncbi:MAG: NADH-quinone oxidoreductase subunit H [Planctomycetota bacterium]|nr:NADH-quinone oxidoreductase subunit H [Planctomycetota bacterium]
MAPYLWKLLPILLVFGGVLGIVPLLVFLERKICALIQDRLGPNRVGILGPDSPLEILGIKTGEKRFLGGLMQPLADAIKLIAKEDIIPPHVEKYLFEFAPFFALLPPFLAFAVIPVGAPLMIDGKEMPLVVADVGVGFLWILAVASLSAYGVALGGWASNNKYALLGGIRATAQMISYEIGLGMALLAVAMQYQSVEPVQIVKQQVEGGFLGWGVFHQPLAFLLFTICAFAENNRLPFDLPECEAELVGGYHTEYSSMKFGMFFQGEYIAMLTMGGLLATLFLGGWHYPGYAALSASDSGFVQIVAVVLSLVSFGIKTMGFVLFSMWVRWTLPRFRYDQLMNLGWKVIVPVALFNIVLTAMLNIH